MNGLYLQEQQARLVASKRKTLVVKPTKLDKYVNEPLFLLSKNRVCGIVRLATPEKIDLVKFGSLYKEHLINEFQRKKWWPDKQELYAYRIELLKLFKPAVYWKLGEHPRTFIDNVEIEKSISVKIPIDNLGAEHLKLLTPAETLGIKKRIEFIATLMDAAGAAQLRRVAATLYRAPEKPDTATDRFILQAQFNDLTAADVGTDMDTLKTKHKCQYILRLQQDVKTMTGWDINAKTLGEAKMPVVAKREQDAGVWLGVAQHPSYIVNLAADKKTKYFTLDQGRYSAKKLSETAMEYTFRGALFKGVYVCSRRYRGKKWTLEAVK